MSFMDFSSWPREQEQAFVVFEQRASESQKKAMTMGIVAALGLLFLLVGIYAGVAPERRDMTKGMNMSNLSHKRSAPAPAPAPAPAAAPAAPAAAAPAAAAPAAAPAAAAPADDKK